MPRCPRASRSSANAWASMRSPPFRPRPSTAIKLTTTLVHASGEWMSSDWPVCPITETAAPHRIGAALTYARRYGLFTLVGIAGEDDLDAPDLPVMEVGSGAAQNRDAANAKANGDLPPSNGNGRAKGLRSPPRNVLPSDASANIRDRMLAEIAGLTSDDDVDRWAYRSLPDKNSLTHKDAQAVEAAFSEKLMQRQIDAAAPQAIDRNDLGFPQTRRVRDKAHLRFVAKQPCIVCGRQPCDPHHLKFAQARGLSLKVSDEFAVPLCRVHHRELHRAGKEVEWWSRTGIEPLAVARDLWLATHPLSGTTDNKAPHWDQSQTIGESLTLTRPEISESKQPNEANSEPSRQ